MEKDSKQKKIISTYKEIGPYLGLGAQLAATVAIMTFLGLWLDDKFNCRPVLTLVCALFGGFAGIYNFIKTVLELDEKNKND